MADKEKDVPGDSSAPSGDGKDKSKPQGGAEDDKDKNFAELRKQLADKDAEIERLKSGNHDADDDDAGDEEEEPSEVEKVAFNRDLREVSLRLKGKLKLTQQQEDALKKVHFTGREVQSEIEAKLKDAYEALPEVKEQREKDLIEKGKREAMREIQDEEMDLGGGGGDADGAEGREPRFNSREAKFLDSMGVSKEERKNIDKGGNTNEWQPGKSPTRKAFVPKS